jgi:hypothetical protein
MLKSLIVAYLESKKMGLTVWRVHFMIKGKSQKNKENMAICTTQWQVVRN